MFQIKVVEKIKTHILCSVTFFRKSCLLLLLLLLLLQLSFHSVAVVLTLVQIEIMLENLEPVRTQMTVWSMRIACRVPKVTNTHSEHVIFFSFPLRQWWHERASVLSYTYIICLVNLQSVWNRDPKDSLEYSEAVRHE